MSWLDGPSPVSTKLPAIGVLCGGQRNSLAKGSFVASECGHTWCVSKHSAPSQKGRETAGWAQHQGCQWETHTPVHTPVAVSARLLGARVGVCWFHPAAWLLPEVWSVCFLQVRPPPLLSTALQALDTPCCVHSCCVPGGDTAEQCGPAPIQPSPSSPEPWKPNQSPLQLGKATAPRGAGFRTSRIITPLMGKAASFLPHMASYSAPPHHRSPLHCSTRI